MGAEPIGREAIRGLWASVLQRALLDCRDGSGRELEDASAWFALDGGTLELVADAIGFEVEFLRRAARRVLVRRFGALEAAHLLGQPLVVRPHRRRTRAAPARMLAAG